MKPTKNITVYKNEEYYSSLHSIIRLNNNELLLAFRQAGKNSVRAAKKGLVTHHDQDTWIASIKSNDNGETWNEETYQIVYKELSHWKISY